MSKIFRAVRPNILANLNYGLRRNLQTSTKLCLDGVKVRSKYPGALDSYFSHELKFITPTESIDTYRVMDENGVISHPENEPGVSQELATKIYQDMVTLNSMDNILYDAQRQGRISFYMTSYGEEGQIGSAAALTPEDVVYGQYREAGVILHRGFTLDEFMNQCYSNVHDVGKGRQMPVHYGSKKLNFQTISSPLATQIPQASGAAYALKMEGKKAVVMCYFGEGAASEGDFHPALNMAATLNCPVIFYCRNNGFAISTPSNEQYRGDGIAARGIGYGVDTIRVDGNDVWAVYNATKTARARALEHNKPILIEAMTYRVGHHSTSDDSTAYRSKQEVEDWKRLDNPITRTRKWLEAKGWWDQTKEDDFRKKIRKDILTSFSKAESIVKPPVEEMFNDVYDNLPPHLQKQKREMEEHVKKYPEFYPTKAYAQKN